jgi:hypothetical protein
VDGTAWLVDRAVVAAPGADRLVVDLVVDGDVVAPDKNPQAGGHSQELGTRLSAGADHRVVVEVVRGDPRDVRYAVIVRTSTRTP